MHCRINQNCWSHSDFIRAQCIINYFMQYIPSLPPSTSKCDFLNNNLLHCRMHSCPLISFLNSLWNSEFLRKSAIMCHLIANPCDYTNSSFHYSHKYSISLVVLVEYMYTSSIPNVLLIHYTLLLMQQQQWQRQHSRAGRSFAGDWQV